jgi:hypothetical protein
VQMPHAHVEVVDVQIPHGPHAHVERPHVHVEVVGVQIPHGPHAHVERPHAHVEVVEMCADATRTCGGGGDVCRCHSCMWRWWRRADATQQQLLGVGAQKEGAAAAAATGCGGTQREQLVEV